MLPFGIHRKLHTYYHPRYKFLHVSYLMSLFLFSTLLNPNPNRDQSCQIFPTFQIYRTCLKITKMRATLMTPKSTLTTFRDASKSLRNDIRLIPNFPIGFDPFNNK